MRNKFQKCWHAFLSWWEDHVSGPGLAGWAQRAQEYMNMINATNYNGPKFLPFCLCSCVTFDFAALFLPSFLSYLWFCCLVLALVFTLPLISLLFLLSNCFVMKAPAASKFIGPGYSGNAIVIGDLKQKKRSIIVVVVVVRFWYWYLQSGRIWPWDVFLKGWLTRWWVFDQSHIFQA